VSINLTLFGQLISFSIFVFICMKFVWPPLVGIMRERQQTIAAGLENAQKAEQQLEQAGSDASQEIEQAKAQAAELIDQANRRASQIIEEAKVAAGEEGDRLKKAAEAEIEQEINRAKEQLRSQVSTLALQGAEKILEASIDRQAHQEMLNRLAAQL
jgi:F-type H+-transporting ATPase subunit b|tara:strand:- start:3065 stop:3535 length:471 start_codon:yes stop_codon:yes gene_type:complete